MLITESIDNSITREKKTNKRNNTDFKHRPQAHAVAVRRPTDTQQLT